LGLLANYITFNVSNSLVLNLQTTSPSNLSNDLIPNLQTQRIKHEGSNFSNSEASNRTALNLQTRSIHPEASNGVPMYIGIKPSNIQTFLKLAISVFALLVTVTSFAKTNELRQAYITWKDAFDLYNYGLYTDCLEDYQKALPLLQHNGEFMINYGKALSIAEKHTEAIEILGKAKNYQTNSVLCTALGDSQKALQKYTNAEKNYWQASEMTPGKFYPQYLLSKLYDENNQQLKAVDIAKSILNKTVKVESTAIKEIHDEMKKIIERN
jgi:tetratricopeptide (TPR) repeat protein